MCGLMVTDYLLVRKGNVKLTSLVGMRPAPLAKAMLGKA